MEADEEIDEMRAGQLTFQGEVLHLMKNIIEREKLPFDVWQEKIDKKGKRPDLIITVKKGPKWDKHCFIEIENPSMNPYDSPLVESAGYKAYRHGVEYFATWTVNELVLWKTFEKDTTLMERRQTYFDSYSVGLQVPTYEAALRKKELNDFLLKFLKHLYAVYVGIEKVERPRPDDVFVRLLRSMIAPIFMFSSHQIWRMYQEDADFRKKLRSWFEKEQMWSPTSAKDVERAARQFAYMLVDKMFFYTVLRRPHDLPDILIPENVSGERAREIIQDRFERILKINYENIFLTDFVDKLPIPDEVVPLLSRFTSELGKYDFSEISYEIIGNIFQELIPPKERHVLGQYFTRSDVVDLIVGFCVKNPNAVILDPACGAGTFLVRSYSRIKNLEMGRKHEKMLDQLYGVEISKFPAHLSTMNLAARNILARLNYPVIINKDFFELAPSARYEIFRGLAGKKTRGELPEVFDTIITNPPYTRQEEMEKQAFPKGYREKLRKLVEKEWNLPIGKKSSIYSHFFFYGGKFLKEGGRLGLITSNSWLDVAYGKYLQEFFLRNFKIVAIIEPKLERWFEDAAINTAITILERCDDETRRNRNVVKFVQLKRPLEELVPTTEDEWERWGLVDKFVDNIESTDNFVEDDKVRIFTKKQEELWNEGVWDGEYQGSKWGRYLRAPGIFFKILEKGKDKLVPLKEVAEVRFGIKTGANEFFYLTEEEIKRRGVEEEFWMHKDDNGNWVPNYVVKSPRECKSVIVNPRDLKYRVLMIHNDKKDLKGTKVLRYIEWGEEQGFHKRPTCASRLRWYDLGERKPAPVLWVKDAFKTHIVYHNPQKGLSDCRFYEVSPYEEDHTEVIIAHLNSTLGMLFAEMAGRTTLGLGARDIMTYEASIIPVLNPKLIKRVDLLSVALKKLCSRDMGDFFDEVGATSPEEVSLGKVKPDRRELDKLVMSEILGLTEDEQLEVYRAVVDLVKSRIERAKSVKKAKGA